MSIFDYDTRPVIPLPVLVGDAASWLAYGVHSVVNNVLIVNKVMAPGRVTAIIVGECLGF